MHLIGARQYLLLYKLKNRQNRRRLRIYKTSLVIKFIKFYYQSLWKDFLINSVSQGDEIGSFQKTSKFRVRVGVCSLQVAVNLGLDALAELELFKWLESKDSNQKFAQLFGSICLRKNFG